MSAGLWFANLLMFSESFPDRFGIVVGSFRDSVLDCSLMVLVLSYSYRIRIVFE
jgi:hypothetical protein